MNSGSFEKSVIKNSVPVKDKLRSYGFSPQKDGLVYKTEILNGEFIFTVFINKEGVFTEVTEKAFNEPYDLYRVSGAEGGFYGRVKSAAESVLYDIKDKCFDNSPFKSQRTKEVILYAKEKYGTDLEFLWKKFPDNAVLRRKDDNLWYAAIVVTDAKNLGLKEEGKKELLLLRGDPSDIDGKTVFTGWHMNKKSWISLILDQRTDREETFRRIDLSYSLAVKK